MQPTHHATTSLEIFLSYMDPFHSAGLGWGGTWLTSSAEYVEAKAGTLGDFLVRL